MKESYRSDKERHDSLNIPKIKQREILKYFQPEAKIGPVET
jgi:hypothetical protein